MYVNTAHTVHTLHTRISIVTQIRISVFVSNKLESESRSTPGIPPGQGIKEDRSVNISGDVGETDKMLPLVAIV